MKILLYVILQLCVKCTISSPQDQKIMKCVENILYDFQGSPFENFVKAYSDYNINTFKDVNYFSLEYFKDMLNKVKLKNADWKKIDTPKQRCQGQYDGELLDVCIDTIYVIGGSADMPAQEAFNHFYLNIIKYDLSVDLLYPNQYPQIKVRELPIEIERKLRIQARLQYKTLMIHDYYTYIEEQVTNKCNTSKFITPLQFCQNHIPTLTK